MHRWLSEEDDGTAPRQMSRRYLAYGGLAALLAGGLVMLLVIFNGIERQLEIVRSTYSDNTAWLISQVQVDAMNLQLAVMRAGDEDPPTPRGLRAVRQNFDILYSRIQLIEGSYVLRHAEVPEQARGSMAEMRSFLDTWAMVVDGPDSAVAAALPRIEAQLDQLAPGVRTGIVHLFQSLVNESDRRRAAFRASVGNFATVSLILITLVSIVVVYVLILYRTLDRRAHISSRIASNLRTTIEASLDSVIVIDAEAKILEYNGAAERMFGRSRQDAINKDFGEVIQTGGNDNSLRLEIARYLQNGHSALINQGRFTSTAARGDGTSFAVEVALSRASDASGRPVFITFVRDVEEQRRYEDSLREARNAAQQGEQAKSRFLAIMSHEMRTPLNGLIGALELLEATSGLSDRQRRLLDVARNCSQMTLEQVNNVLELTRIEASDTVPPAAAPFRPANVLQEILDQNRAMAHARGNRLWLNLGPGLAEMQVMGLRQQFSRVAANLIGNAVKFTENGKVRVSLSLHERSETHIDLLLEVTDTGIGIAPENLERIFNNFETIDGSYSRVATGTGLGLGIARMAADVMGGTISVTSQLGLGSSFTLRVGFPRVTAASVEMKSNETRDPALASVEPPDESDARTTSLRVLIVEDNEINRFVLGEILRSRGHDVHEVCDGRQAVDAATGTGRFDLILMDISMPVMDGLEATRLIRADARVGTTPIIGVTAHAIPEEIDRFKACGMTEVITKPVSGAALDAALAALAQAEPVAVEPVQTERHSSTAPQLQPVTLADYPLIDPAVEEETREMLGADLRHNLIERFRAEMATALPQLDAQSTEDAERCSALAHRLAGAAAVMGARRLHKALLALEDALREGAAAQPSLSDVHMIWVSTEDALIQLDDATDPAERPGADAT
ncbi:ATP-binding protein [Halodurantibacterium flavum]|uniref:histidine kinase n=1 Tax=Halodurantibacterium flavum TaxID=1382802 RepID=A0ABW4S4Q9_9RHOB